MKDSDEFHGSSFIDGKSNFILLSQPRKIVPWIHDRIIKCPFLIQFGKQVALWDISTSFRLLHQERRQLRTGSKLDWCGVTVIRPFCVLRRGKHNAGNVPRKATISSATRTSKLMTGSLEYH